MPAARATAIFACALLTSGAMRMSSDIASPMALRAVARNCASLARSNAFSKASTTGFASKSIGMLLWVELEFQDQVTPAHQILGHGQLLAVVFGIDDESSPRGRIHIEVRAFRNRLDQHIPALIGQSDFHAADVGFLALDFENQLDRKLVRDFEHRLALRRAGTTRRIGRTALLVHLGWLHFIRRLEYRRGERKQETCSNKTSGFHFLNLGFNRSIQN